MIPRKLFAALAATALLSLGATACGGTDDDTSEGGGTPPPAQGGSTSGGGGGGGSSTTGSAGRGDTDGGTSGGNAAGGAAGDGAAGAGGGAGASGPSGPSGAPDPVLAGDREQAQRGLDAVDDVYSGLEAAIANAPARFDGPLGPTLDSANDNPGLIAMCDQMSEDAQRNTVEYVRRAAGLSDVEWTCEKATALLLRRSAVAGRLERSLNATVVGVNARGDRATASVRFGGANSPVVAIQLIKEDGEWKLQGSPAGGNGNG